MSRRKQKLSPSFVSCFCRSSDEQTKGTRQCTVGRMKASQNRIYMVKVKDNLDSICSFDWMDEQNIMKNTFQLENLSDQLDEVSSTERAVTVGIRL